MHKLLQIPLWKTYILFLWPLVLMFLLTNIGIGEEALHSQYNWKFYLIFGSLSILLMMLWHYLMGLSFYAKAEKRGNLFKINGLIPLLFYTLLFGRSIYEFMLFLDRREMILANMEKGTMRVVDLGWISLLFNFLVIHSIVALFINNNLIRNDIRKLYESKWQESFVDLYLKPMKKVAKTFLFSLILLVVGGVIYDIIKLFF